MITLLLWLFVFVVLSAFFSGAEMAFVSSDRLKMHDYANDGQRSAKRIVKFYEKSQHFLTTILIGNNIANMGATSLCTYMLIDVFDIHSEWVVTLIMAPLLLIFSEMLPKDYCRVFSMPFLLSFSNLLVLVSRAFSILTHLILKCVNLFLSPLGAAESKSIFVSEAEFRSLVEESIKTGVVGKQEKKIIDTILDFERLRVRTAMTAIDDVPKVDIQSNVADVKQIAKETGAKMLLVYEEIPSIVVGMIYVFDLLFEEKDQKGLQPFLRAPIFISESTSYEKAFFTLQQKRQSYAVITDSYKDVVGVVAIDRLLGHG